MASYLTYRNVLVSNSTVNASTLNAGTVQFSTLRVASTVISLGQSTSQTNNFSGSFTAWASTLSTTASTAGAGLTAVRKVTMSQSGQYQLAVQSSVSAYSVVKSSDSGVTWQTLTNGANGLPKGAVAYPQATATGNPAYTSVSYSATGQYALASVNGGLLYVSNNATAATPTFTAVGMGTPTIYMPFEGSTADVIGTVSPAVNPTPTGSMAYVTGAVGTQALNLVNTAGASGNTATNYIRYTVPTNMTSFTISGRFNSQSLATTGFPTILSMYSQALVLFINPLTLNQLYLNYPTGTGSGQASIFTTTGISLNTWYSFTIIYQIGTVSLYVNNVLIGTGTSTGLGTFTGSTLGLACYDSSTAQPFNGYIDDLRIYNSAVTFSPIVPANWSHTAVSATGQYMLAAASGGGLFQSTNFGQTWTQVNALLNGGVWTSLSQSESGQYALATTSAASIMPQLTGLTAASWSVNGVSWVASASSIYPTTLPQYAFNTVTTTPEWISAGGTYSSTGNTSGYYTFIQGVGSVQGDWLQIQSSVPLVMYSYQFATGYITSRLPKTYYIVGSNDGSTWYPVQYGSGGAVTTTAQFTLVPSTIVVNTSGTQTFGSSSVTFTTYSTTTNAYTYFRLVGLSTYSGTAEYFSIAEWPINFVGGLAYTSNYGQTWSNAANSLFADSSAVSGDGQYTLGVSNQPQPYIHLPFENTKNDSRGILTNATNGTGSGAVTFPATQYKVGTNAAYITNTAGATSSLSYLNYTVPAALNTPSTLSVSFWLYIAANHASGQSCPLGFNNGTTTPGPYFYVNTNGQVIYAYYTPSSGSITSTSAVAVGGWNHVVGIVSSGVVSLYLNGVFQANATITGNLSLSSGGSITNLFIGCTHTGSGGFAGYVDDVRIYTSALTVDNINTLYTSSSSLIAPTLNLGSNYLTGLTGSSYTPITLANIAYYPLNDAVASTLAVDAVNGYNATVSGTVTFGATGKLGTAATIGASGYLALPSVLYSRWNNLTAGSISCWIYPTTLGVYTLFNKQDNSSTPYSLLGINYTANGTTYNTNRVYFSMTNTLFNVNCCSNTALAINTWYHIVVTFNSVAVKFYINGVLDNTYTASWTLANQPSPTNMTIGGVYNGSSTYTNFVGTIDEFSLWTSELSLSSVQALYNGGTPISLIGANVPINCASCSNTGQYMVVVTQGTTNNVYYSTNYGSTWTALTVGSSAMTSCAMSVDGTYITVSNAANVYTLNWNGQGFTVALGSAAGAVNQASNAIAIGNQAGQTNQTANSIVLNASGAAVNPYTQGFYVAPIQPAISSLAPTFPLLGYGSDNQIVQSATSFSNSQQTVYGEWIQYQLATASPITSYTLQSRTGASVLLRYPISWIVVGSNDATNWTLLDTQTGTAGWGTYTLTQVTALYTYYRIVFTQINVATLNIGAFILNNGSPLFGPSANYTVVASGNYNVLQQNSVTVCTTTWSWPVIRNSLGIVSDGSGVYATYQPGWLPTTDGYTNPSTNYFLGFSVNPSFGPAYEYNGSGIAFQGTTTTINTTVLGNTNMAGTLCLMSGSRVGIGSLSPQYALDVAGTAQVNGTIPAYGQPDSSAVVPNSTFGQTWNVVTGLSTNTFWYGAAVSATGQYMTVCVYGAASGNNIYYSSNYGSTWTLATGFAANVNYASVSMSGSGQYQLVGINTAASAIYLSTNYGATWAAISGLTGNWYRYALSYTGQYQFIGESVASTGKVYFSSNYGASFTQVTAFTGNVSGGICCSASGQYVTVTLNGGYIWYSSNYGISWASFNTTGAWQGVCCSASGQYQTAALYNGSLYYSNNYGVSWTSSGSPTSNWVNVTCSASGQYQMATGNSMGVYYSNNYGVSWTQSSAPSGNWLIAMSQNGLYTLGMITSGSVYLSTLTNIGLVTNGRVGIGVTNPAALFHMVGPTTTINPYTLPTLGSASNSCFILADPYNRYGLSIVRHDNSGAIHFQSQYFNGTTNALPLTLNPMGGNVGIGTTAPSTGLHVNSATQFSGIQLTNTYNGTTGSLGFYIVPSAGGNYINNSTGNAAVILPLDGKDLYIGRTTANNASLVVQGGTGNVGIGLTNPTTALHVVGTITGSTKNFDIPHPSQPSKHLVHSCIEGPRIDLLYRGTKTLVAGQAIIDINRECTFRPEDAMDHGTFEALCANPDVFLQNRTGFARVMGSITAGTLTITCEDSTSRDTISWMVVAERKDPHVLDAPHTDADGYLITQYSA